MSPTSIQQHGGRFVARGGKCDVLEGSWTPKRLVILEFPNAARAREWWASTEYAPAKALRQATSTGDMVVIEGVGVREQAAYSDFSAINGSTREARRAGR